MRTHFIHTGCSSERIGSAEKNARATKCKDSTVENMDREKHKQCAHCTRTHTVRLASYRIHSTELRITEHDVHKQHIMGTKSGKFIISLNRRRAHNFWVKALRIHWVKIPIGCTFHPLLRVVCNNHARMVLSVHIFLANAIIIVYTCIFNSNFQFISMKWKPSFRAAILEHFVQLRSCF